jgi:hypothetical protein
MSSLVLPRAATGVTLGWDPSSDGNVAGYRIYEGVSSQNYTSSMDVGNVTSVTFSGLTIGMTYFFAVTAYTADGVESPFSGEISYTPGLPVQPQLQLTVNSAKQVLLTGNGPAGYQYAVEATQDFVHWTVIGSVTMDATGSFQFVDPSPANGSGRAYRLRQTVPQPSGLPAQPQLRLTVNSAKQVILTGNGPAGYQYAVEATQDLANWTVVGNVTMDATDSFQFVDPTPANGPGRGYRLRQTSL